MGGEHVDAVADKLLTKLRQIAPHKVRVYDNSDEHRDVAVPNRRKRWSQVVETIEARPWVRCELMNKTGEVLGYIDNDGEAKELEELGSGGPSGTASQRWFLEMMLRSQETALKWRSKEHSELLTGMRDLLEVNTHATRELIEIFRVQRDVSSDVAAMRAAAENGGDIDQIVKLLEASPALLQILGPLIMSLRGKQAAPKQAAKPNGVKS
jgi:hypothetical protein